MTQATPELAEIPIEQFGERHAQLRIVNPKADKAMVRSLEKYGQLTPVVVNRSGRNQYELLDGFKRLRGGRALSFPHLRARILELNERAGKAVIMQMNWVGKSISSMEEALVVHSLFHEDKLTQVEIAVLLGRHKSWVCRRIALIERLCGEAQNSIKLGLIPVSMGRDLARLPHGNQEALLETINRHRLNCHETRKIVTALRNSPKHQHDAILSQPLEILHPRDDDHIPHDKKYDPLVNELRRKLLTMERHCLIAVHSFNTTEIGQFSEEEELLLITCYKQAVAVLDQARLELQQIINAKQRPTP